MSFSEQVKAPQEQIIRIMLNKKLGERIYFIDALCLLIDIDLLTFATKANDEIKHKIDETLNDYGFPALENIEFNIENRKSFENLLNYQETKFSLLKDLFI